MAARRDNICYAQSGGVTAVINTTAAAAITAAKKAGRKTLAAKNGITGVLQEALFETWREAPATIGALRHTPGGAFGSCRTKLPDPRQDLRPYRRLLAVFRAHNIGCFLYNGGNDSADTTLKISAAMKMLNDNLVCVGVPKTIDNDLPGTDCCPGFGSVAKYVAVSVAETSRDIAAMAATSTKVFVMEVMGRNAGWIAAAAALGMDADDPLLIIFPEVPFNPPAFVAAVQKQVRRHGYAVVVVSEGARDSDGAFLSAGSSVDNFSHRQLGGVAPRIAALITKEIGYKCHWAVADYLQRAARHIASATDLKQAAAVGASAVKMALAGQDAMMPVIWRTSDSPYQWEIGEASLKKIANRERKMPKNYIRAGKFSVTTACRRYLQPLIVGEDRPPFTNGLPRHARLKNIMAVKKLPPYESA